MDNTNNWFTGNMPVEIKKRADDKFNVWQMKPIVIDGDTELRWHVIGVTDTFKEAKSLISVRK